MIAWRSVGQVVLLAALAGCATVRQQPEPQLPAPVCPRAEAIRWQEGPPGHASVDAADRRAIEICLRQVEAFLRVRERVLR